PRAAGIVPAVGAAPAHLAVDHDTASPRAVALVAVLARAGRLLARHVGEEGLDVAAAHEVELLLLAALDGEAAARLRHEAAAQRACRLVEIEAVVAALLG